jgi:tetratricopeptide (TPR) repeat protein
MPDLFISHATADDPFVAELRQELEALQIPVWVDSRNLRGGDKLAPEIESAIEEASRFLVVLSPSTVNSAWVRREIQQALEVEKSRQADGYRVIPLLLPGITPGALGTWFDAEPLGVKIEIGPDGLTEALPEIYAALGEALPDDHQPVGQPGARPLEELLLTLTDPRIETADGKRRAAAMATLAYAPATPGARGATSRRFPFTAPLGPIETDDLRWYLESYFLWPVGVFKDRAAGIEQKLPDWGNALFQAALGGESARDALSAWQNAAPGTERLFSVLVEKDLPEGADEKDQTAAREAATELLALPWELLHDGRAWLFQGNEAVRVRRRLPDRRAQPARPTALPLRILLVSPRPEKDRNGSPVAYIDHRASAWPLTEAVEKLGALAQLTLLDPPTYEALEQALQDAAGRGKPFDVVHFDGHGVYNQRIGLGGLCFEDPDDVENPEERALDFVDAVKLAGLVRKHRIPLVFLDACQTSMAEVDPAASVAARLLEEGVTSVVGMSHSVLVETSRRFVEAFYRELAGGARVGQAMLAGQRALFSNTGRGKIPGAGELRLQDWFVPVLYQEEHDPQLVTRIPSQPARHLAEKKRQLSLGALPDPPAHHFQGRSRELLTLERLLFVEPWAVVRGTGGQGKTTLAAELARWLVRTARFARAAFVSLEHHRDARAVLDTLGHQLLGPHYTVAEYSDLDKALQPIARALADQATLVVLDNCESVLPERTEPAGSPSAEDASTAIFTLCQRLLKADPRTRLVFTTREPLPAPFNNEWREQELGALRRHDAIELVNEVMQQNGWTPPKDDAGTTPQEIADLVEAVHCHARALVLLAPEVARRGVKATTGDLRSLMADLQRKHPGDRENSLYASVELSLRRLAEESREHVRVLAVCQGGVHLAILGMLTGLEPDAARQLAAELIEVGLGKNMGYGHLRLDPGLSPYLLGELTAEETDDLRSRWAEAMVELTEDLHGEHFKDARVASRLTLLDLSNLLAMLDWLQVRWPPERVVDLAHRVERLVAELGQPQALARATRVREQAAEKLGEWSHARFTTENAHIDRLCERGDLSAAHAAAQQLLEKCLAATERAYTEAAYETATAYFNIGRVRVLSGAADAALAPLLEAHRRFQELANSGIANAESMAILVVTDLGNCLLKLGRLDEAARAYEIAIERSTSLQNLRQVAVAKFQLGTVSLHQKRYRGALEIYMAARDAFEALGEPRSVASVWHQIGIVHQESGQIEPAEQAFRQSLAINVREGNFSGQVLTLLPLGKLSNSMGRFEEAATFHRHAAEVYVQLKDLAMEGRARNNLAGTLINLHRYDDARQELHRAIECDRPYGHAAEPWKNWAILESLERTTGHAEEAQDARQRAIATYLAYRRAGGASHSPIAQLYALAGQVIQENAEDEARQDFVQLAADPDVPPLLKTLIARLQSILAGDRDPTLADDSEFFIFDAAELQLLLEALGRDSPDVGVK